MGDRDLDLLIRGDLVTPEEIARDSGVGIRDGRIVGLYGPGETPPARETIDARGSFIFPGIVDAHVHSYSVPGWEGFEHSSAAAAAGGVTTFIEMPYDAGAPTVNPEIFEQKIERVSRYSRVDIALLATLKKEGMVEVIPPLLNLGACGFKLSLFETDPDRFPRIEDGTLGEVLPVMAAYNVPVGFHAELDAVIFHLIRKYRQQGKSHPGAHAETRPPITETMAVLKLLEWAYWTRCRLHFYHISHPRSVRLINLFREEGVNVTAETCPHYLILHAEDMDRLKALGKINPPLQSREAVEQMWQTVMDEGVDMISSDHAPWPLEKKQAPDIFDNASGAPGVETLFPMVFSEGVMKRGLSPRKLARLLCENPARRFRLYPRKGRIALNADADLAILDPKVSWVVRGGKMHSSAKWSPYEGMTVQGKVTQTFLRGKVVYDGDRVTALPGNGRFIPAQEER